MNALTSEYKDTNTEYWAVGRADNTQTVTGLSILVNPLTFIIQPN